MITILDVDLTTTLEVKVEYDDNGQKGTFGWREMCVNQKEVTFQEAKDELEKYLKRQTKI